MNYTVNLYRKYCAGEMNRTLSKRTESNRVESRERIGKIEEKVNDNVEEAYGLLWHCH